MQYYKYVHKENILADGTIPRVPRKGDDQQFGCWVGPCSARFLESSWSYFLQSVAFKCQDKTSLTGNTNSAIVCGTFPTMFFVIDWIEIV